LSGGVSIHAARAGSDARAIDGGADYHLVSIHAARAGVVARLPEAGGGQDEEDEDA
jgi:hypothetical protein